MKKEKSCGAVIYYNNNGTKEYLVLHMALGHYSLTKGHVENNESEEETALREIKEETNLDVVIDTSFRYVISYSPYPGIEKDVIFFVAEAKNKKTINQESEVQGIEWLKYLDAYNRMTYKTDKDTLEAAEEYLNK